MPFSLSLEQYEVEALMAWHREQQYEAARKEDYVSAEDHKRRCEALSLILTSGQKPRAA